MTTVLPKQARRRALLQLVLGVAQMTGAVTGLALLLQNGVTPTVVLWVLLTAGVTILSLVLRRWFWK